MKTNYSDPFTIWSLGHNYIPLCWLVDQLHRIFFGTATVFPAPTSASFGGMLGPD